MLPEFPHVRLERVNVLEAPVDVRELGVKRVPTLIHGDNRLSVLFLTKTRIRRFLGALTVAG